MAKEFLYKPLSEKPLSDEGSSDVESNDDSEPERGVRRWFTPLLIVGSILPWILVVILSVVLFRTRTWGNDRFAQTKLFSSQLTYSPAQNEIEYYVKKYDHNLEDADMKFRDPNTVDEAWSDLYNFGMSSISKDQARRMTNRTSPIVPGDPSRYIIQLDVFHQLHCLNVLRIASEPYYHLKNESLFKINAERAKQHLEPLREHENLGVEPHHLHIDAQHLNHCLNSLRQSIMCHSDVSPVVWHWDHPAERVEFNRGFLNVTHTCRNYDRIRDWALEHQNHKPFDHFVRYEEDDFEIPIYRPS